MRVLGVCLLPSLANKGTKFILNDACERSFMELKERLTTSPILALPTIGAGYVVFSDASMSRLGYVLRQNEKVITYVYCRLKDFEKNYPIHDLELAAVVFSLQLLLHYLYGEFVRYILIIRV